MKYFLSFLLITLSLCSFAQIDTTQQITPNRENSIENQQKPYVILISLDGFRWDLADKFQAQNILKLRQNGVRADYLKPSYPSLTFPNHYTIATGLYPSHHGIVDNQFYDKAKNLIYRKSDPKALDSSWYGGKPLWILAEEQKMLSAVFYWPGSEISMNGIRPTYYYNYNEIIPTERRINIVKNWLELPAPKRPHFIALYFHQVDYASHLFKVESKETEAAVKLVDDAIGKLVDAAQSTGLPINFILVSDHGMTTIDKEQTLALPKEIDRQNFTVPPGTSLLHLYAKDRSSLKSTYKALKSSPDFDTYLKKETPKYWHYRKKDDIHNRIGDILLVPKLPKVFSITGAKPNFGQHGFDPQLSDMHGIFYAWGPNFKTNLEIPAFDNVHIYPLVAEILNLKYNHHIDGKKRILFPTLK